MQLKEAAALDGGLPHPSPPHTALTLSDVTSRGPCLAGDTLVVRISKQELTTPVGGLVGGACWNACSQAFQTCSGNKSSQHYEAGACGTPVGGWWLVPSCASVFLTSP